MSDLHIDDFYKDAALILLQLYKNFPRKITLFVEDIAGPDVVDDFGLHSERHLACFSTIRWLADSHYLHFDDTIREEATDQTVLSHKAFTLLASPAQEYIPTELEHLPDSVQQRLSTNVAQLRLAIKAGSTSSINQLVQSLLVQSRQHSI